MKKYFWPVVFILIIAGALFIYPYYQRIFAPNVNLESGDTYEFYIHTGMDYTQVGKKLMEEDVIVDPKGFHFVSERMNYPRNVRPGRYIIEDGMSNRELVTLLRSGIQTPIQYTFVKHRTKDELSQQAAEAFEFGASELMRILNNEEYLRKYGLNTDNVMAIFIPNTYEMYWTTTAEGFFDRMYKEYRKFWNDDRNKKRERFNLTRLEVMAIASIVEEETNMNDEKARIAGVYFNRIRNKWPLEADPTVRYALGDFELKRILNEHLEVESPFNTYKYPGIPPGPICTPSISSIDAVLNAERHDYMFFCAKSDFSGYHTFSKTLEEHNQNAREYHSALTVFLKKKATEEKKKVEGK